MQTFLTQVASLGQQLIHCQLAEFFHFHGCYAALTRWRERNLVRTGSLSAARRRDSRATDSGTPSSSNKMLPGRTVATQNMGWPLPLPIRVSGGRAVTGLSGKTRIHNFPFRFMLRVSATRAASSWVFVIQARSSVCRPNSPKSILRLREAVPFRLPRWAFRYFTRFGINGIKTPPKLQPARVGAVVAQQVRWELRRAALLSYKSNISRRSCHKPYWPQQNRNQLRCAACAVEFFPLGTIPNVRSQRRSVDRSNEA